MMIKINEIIRDEQLDMLNKMVIINRFNWKAVWKRDTGLRLMSENLDIV